LPAKFITCDRIGYISATARFPAFADWLSSFFWEKFSLTQKFPKCCLSMFTRRIASKSPILRWIQASQTRQNRSVVDPQNTEASIVGSVNPASQESMKTRVRWDLNPGLSAFFSISFRRPTRCPYSRVISVYATLLQLLSVLRHGPLSIKEIISPFNVFPLAMSPNAKKSQCL
jgi:hypothetical protein